MKPYFKGRHSQKDIILVAVGYYFRFSLSYRDIVEILRDRGITVHHTTIMHWLRKRRPDAKYILLDDQDYIISSIHTRGVMVAMTLLGNDGTELIKMVSPENMSIKIEEVKK